MNIVKELIRIAKQLHPSFLTQRQGERVKILEENGYEIATWDAEGIYLQKPNHPNDKMTVYQKGNAVHGWIGDIG